MSIRRFTTTAQLLAWTPYQDGQVAQALDTSVYYDFSVTDGWLPRPTTVAVVDAAATAAAAQADADAAQADADAAAAAAATANAGVAGALTYTDAQILLAVVWAG